MTEVPPPDPSDPELRPGDEGHPGTPGMAENLCPECSGSGRTSGGDQCEVCAGTGRVSQALGGA